MKYTHDERVVRINGQVSFYVLMLTHIAMTAVILYRIYVRGLNENSHRGFQIVLLLSIAGYWGARLYFSGTLPVLSRKQFLSIYAILVGGLFGFLSWRYGLPKMETWYNTLLPVVTGPALILGFYNLMAYWGQRRLEKELSE
jgi:hypothetical protein